MPEMPLHLEHVDEWVWWVMELDVVSPPDDPPVDKA